MDKKYVYVITEEVISDYEKITDNCIAVDDKDLSQYRFNLLVEEKKKEAEEKGFDDVHCDIPTHFECGIKNNYTRGSICVKLRKVELHERSK